MPEADQTLPPPPGADTDAEVLAAATKEAERLADAAKDADVSGKGATTATPASVLTPDQVEHADELPDPAGTAPASTPNEALPGKKNPVDRIAERAAARQAAAEKAEAKQPGYQPGR